MRYWYGCWIAPAAFAFDRVSKWAARSMLRGNAPVEALPGVLRLVYIENTGAAFGILSGRRILLLVLTGAGLLAVLLFPLLTGQRLSRLMRASVWLVAGGAAGNFHDRLFTGHVADFLEITAFRFPVFNIADMCVVIGIFLFASGLRSVFREDAHDA